MVRQWNWELIGVLFALACFWVFVIWSLMEIF